MLFADKELLPDGLQSCTGQTDPIEAVDVAVEATCEIAAVCVRRDDPDAACAADGSIEPVPGLGSRAASFFTLDGVFHDVQLHAIDATSARWRGGARPSPVDSVS